MQTVREPESKNKGSCQKSEPKDRERENMFDCKLADYEEILQIGELIHTRPARKSAGILSTSYGEDDKPTSVESGQLLQRISPRSKTEPIKAMSVFDTRGRMLGR